MNDVFVFNLVCKTGVADEAWFVAHTNGHRGDCIGSLVESY